MVVVTQVGQGNKAFKMMSCRPCG